MKKIILMLLVSQFANANECFSPGNYVGQGMYKTASGSASSYEISVNMNSAAEAKTHFKWPGSEIEFTYSIRDNKVYIDDSKTSAGSVECRLGSMSLKLDSDKFSLVEEWLTVGNYLLISGHKDVGTNSVDYLEVLLKQ